MIIIIDSDFKIQIDKYGFDLIKVVEARKKGDGTISTPTGEKYTREETIGYYTTLESVIKEVIHIRQSEKDIQITLREFIKDYKTEREKIEKLIDDNAIPKQN